MSTVLHVVGSPRGSNSASSQLATTFLDAYRSANADDEIVVCDTWSDELPDFAGPAAEGKLQMMAGQSPEGVNAEAFAACNATIEQLVAADKIVVSSGMWNFGLPYRLKQWIDIVVQPGRTFGFDPERGYFGLLEGKRVQFLLATGGNYSEGPMVSFDMLEPYLRNVFGFMGVQDQRVVTMAHTAFPPDVSGPAREAALAAAKSAAAEF